MNKTPVNLGFSGLARIISKQSAKIRLICENTLSIFDFPKKLSKSVLSLWHCGK